VTLDPNAMTRLLEITGGDAAFVDELVETFLDDATVQLDALRTAGAANDVAGIVRPAHSLKSNSDNVGATALADQCRSLEADGRAGTVPGMAARIAAVETEFAAVRSALLEARAAR
jgi:HPt (histidine-containing phosphotransfer) domain-containing protein